MPFDATPAEIPFEVRTLPDRRTALRNLAWLLRNRKHWPRGWVKLCYVENRIRSIPLSRRSRVSKQSRPVVLLAWTRRRSQSRASSPELGLGSMPSSCRTWANFFGSTRRRSVIIARRAVRPASVKNSRGKWPSLSSRMRPRAINPFAVGGSFGLPASGPLRQVLR
jgi:hypothetical protein